MFSHIDEVCQSWDVIHSDQNTWLRGKEPFGCLLTCCELCSLSALFTCSQFREFSCWYKRSKQNWELGIFAFFLTLLQLRLFSFLFLGSQTENYLKHTFFFWKKIKAYYIFCVFSPTLCVILLYLPTFISSHYVDSFWKEKQTKTELIKNSFWCQIIWFHY